MRAASVRLAALPGAARAILLGWAFLGPQSTYSEERETCSGVVSLPRGLSLDCQRGVVSRAGTHAPLSRRGVGQIELDRKESQVELLQDTCWTFGERPVTRFTLDMLEARVENAAALKLHRARRHAEAAVGFKRAQKLDPAFLLSTFNLAATLNLAGQTDAALAALAPLLDARRIRTYLALHEDPELRSLLATPTLRALFTSDPPGTATLPKFNPDFIAYSAKHRRLAVLDPHDGLRIFSLKTGNLDTIIDLGNRVLAWSGESSAFDQELRRQTARQEALADAVLEQKRPLIDRLFADLGFVAALPRDSGKIIDEDPVKKVLFKAPGTQLVIRGFNLQLMRQGRVLSRGEHYGAEHFLQSFILLPALDTVVWRWRRSSGPSDCNPQRGTEVLTPAGEP